MSAATDVDRIISEIDRALDEIVQLTADLVRIPTVNPPGEEYETCARVLGDYLGRHGYQVIERARHTRPDETREIN